MSRKKKCVICWGNIPAERFTSQTVTVKTCSSECARFNKVKAKNINYKASKRFGRPKGFLNISVTDWMALVRKYGGRCAYCRLLPAKTLDHVVPLSLGGRHALVNVLPCCEFCNKDKGGKTYFEWRVRGRNTPIFDELVDRLDFRW